MTDVKKLKTGEWVVYPTHGVGQVQGIEKQEIAGIAMELLIVEFPQSRLTIRLPMARAQASGLRTISSKDTMKQALGVLKGKSKQRRVMWARRAQEYENKLNTGEIMQVAEVLRDLARVSQDPDQSFSERQLYENALSRMSMEMAVLNDMEPKDATSQVEQMLIEIAS